MDWITLTVVTTTQGADIVSEQLIEAGSVGTMIQDRNDYTENQRPKGQWDILDESLYRDMDARVRVTGYYPEELNAAELVGEIGRRLTALRRAGGPVDFGELTLITGGLADEDWAECWKKNFAPIRLGKRIVVKPGWAGFDAAQNDLVIHLDPGMAFGTGTHETTGMCVELLEQHVKPGDRVTDIGTGSGILAIAAALLGAREVLATDIDPVAVRVAAENIADNHLSGVIRTRQGDLLKAVGEDEIADLVSANIIADAICSLAQPVRSRIRDGGIFICSGIARDKRDMVLQALENARYRDIDVREKGEWCAIAARK